ncbi:phosphoribosylanthranilate isomerase [Agrilactobacillus composti DSM 18527 = JCM 14202]|nr:phosphoribosylanthranilate isomerase [Agrilactobacillus composti]GAF40488.1 phosphoribosylanthranilate isomerase [Agrilactobacillus composti DSM 18527 = JCM 14202]
MVKVKICGLMTNLDVLAVNETAADLAGFVFAPSRHQIQLAQALSLKAQLNPNIQTVGVFVHEDFATIKALYDAGAIDIAQLHGATDPVLVQRLQAVGLRVIQVFQNKAIDATSPADYLMVDSGQGSGQTLAWKPLPQLEKPVILAGGLTATNVAEAIVITQPDIVDVSSGVESAGHKDPQKISAFVENAKGVRI